jgi:tetratricopeptide (TPR) repeat protein
MRVRTLLGLVLSVQLSACAGSHRAGSGYGNNPRFAPSAYEHYIRGRVASERGDHELAAAEMLMSAAVAPNEPEPRLAVVDELLAAGHVDAAQSEAAFAVASWPDDAGAWRNLGRVRSAAADIRGAAEAFEHAVALSKDDEESWLMLGAAYRQLRQEQRALEAYRRLVAAMPLSAEGHFRLGRMLQSADANVAIIEFKRAIELDSGHIDARVALADLYRRQDQKADAEKTLREAFDRSGDDAQVGERLYRVLLENGDRDGAIELLRRLDADWRDGRARLRIARLLLELHKSDEALRIARAVLGKDEINQGHIVEARALAQLGRRSEAIAACLATRPGDDDYADARALAADLHGRDGTPQEGLKIIDEALGQRPDDPVLVTSAAALHEQLGAFDRARSLLDAALTQSPGNDGLVYARADLEDRAAQPDRAVAVMQTLLDRDANSVVALNFIGYSYAERGIDLDTAERLLRRAIVLRPDDGLVLDSFGWMLYRRGRTEEARAILERADRLSPFEPEILLHLGEVYLRAGLVQRARDSFRQALGLDPSDRLRASLEERVRKLEARAP